MRKRKTAGLEYYDELRRREALTPRAPGDIFEDWLSDYAPIELNVRNVASAFAEWINSNGWEDFCSSDGYVFKSWVPHPRPVHADNLLRLARKRGLRLTMDDIYAHSRAVRADKIKLGPGLPSSPGVGPVTGVRLVFRELTQSTVDLIRDLRQVRGKRDPRATILRH